MNKGLDWTNWILEKNAKAQEEELKKSDFAYTDSLEKASSTELRNSVKAANSKLKAAGIEGGYGVTSHDSPHWDYSYNDKPEHHKAIKEAHSLIEPHLPEGSTHEDYDIGGGERHTYGGHPDHVNSTAAKHPQGMLSVKKSDTREEDTSSRHTDRSINPNLGGKYGKIHGGDPRKPSGKLQDEVIENVKGKPKKRISGASALRTQSNSKQEDGKEQAD